MEDSCLSKGTHNILKKKKKKGTIVAFKYCLTGPKRDSQAGNQLSTRLTKISIQKVMGEMGIETTEFCNSRIYMKEG